MGARGEDALVCIARVIRTIISVSEIVTASVWTAAPLTRRLRTVACSPQAFGLGSDPSPGPARWGQLGCWQVGGRSQAV